MNKSGKTKLHLSKSFFKTFFLLLGVFLACFLAFTLYTYQNTTHALQNEYLSLNKQQTASLVSSLDDRIKNGRYIMGSLYSNATVQSFFHSANASDSAIVNTISDNLYILKNASRDIHSIYVYSSASNRIIASDNSTSYSPETFGDTTWIEYLQDASAGSYYLFLRSDTNNPNCLITILKVFPTSYGPGAVIVNMSLNNVVQLQFHSHLENAKLYIVSDDSEVIYSHNQRQYKTPVTYFSDLEKYDGALSDQQYLQTGAEPYIYTQQHSSDYPWSYILITDVSDYSIRLASTQSFLVSLLILAIILGLVMIFIIVFRASKPVNAILHLLNNPEDFVSYDISDIPDAESQQMIQKILTYIQTNSALSAELEKQFVQLNDARMMALQLQINPHFLMNTLTMLHILTAETLGTEHEVSMMTVSLSRLLSYSLDSAHNASLEAEVEHARIYAKLINFRHQNSIYFTFDFPQDIEDIIVPKLIIQPLIENAVFHGLTTKHDTNNSYVLPGKSPDRLKKIKIAIKTEPEENLCILVVTDNGTGIAPDRLAELTAEISDYAQTPSASIGLHNVMLRMHLLYGDAFSFKIESTGYDQLDKDEEAATSVFLMFPLH